MTINLIACVTKYKNRLAIGKNDDLLFKLKDDMKFFKNITSNSLSIHSKLDKNIVLMGRKTYFSIPNNFRPLKNRINFVLTKDPNMLKISPVPKNLKLTKDVYFLTLNTFKEIYFKYNPNVFVIGGAQIYNMFFNDVTLPGPHKLYITHVQTVDLKDLKFEASTAPDTFMDNFNSQYKLTGYSEKYITDKLSYRVLYYNLTGTASEESKYLDLAKHILEHGKERINRTGINTIGVFGAQLRFDISQSIPLMTTKRVPFKTIVSELLWMLRGDTDAKILERKGISIWSGNTSREFLDKQNLQHYPEGILGAGYGFQYRHFGAKYSPAFGDTSKVDTSLIGGTDQLKYVEDLLQNDPFSRRIMISAWNPPDFKKTALVPCFPGGTLVLTNNGYKNIENVLLSDKLFTHKGNWKDIVNLQQKEYDDEMYEFQLMYNSKKIEATKEHPFFVRNVERKKDGTIITYSKEPYWCDAKDITKNHIMCLPINKSNKIPEFNINKGINQYKDNIINKKIENKNEWFMLGYFIGDGWINLKDGENKFNFVINKTQMYVFEKISSIVHLTFKNDTESVTTYICSNKIWWEIIKDFGHLAHNKKIPEWVQDAPKEYIEWFIEGYLAADGCKTNKNYGIYTTVSSDLAYGLQRLYAKIGKMLSVTYQIRPKTKIIEGRTVNQRNTYNMRLVKTSKRKYIKNVDDDYINFPILKINKEIKNAKVYNFEVVDDNSYTVQNISVHNCHYSIQFYVTEEKGERYLSCMFIMRSSDGFLGLPCNFLGYSVLTYILAKKYNMKPKELVYISGDGHIYKNHVPMVKDQLIRICRPFPKLKLDDSIITKEWNVITEDDFELIGYFSHPSIKAPMTI
jgi:thymidylate synthase/dihydrofolate reductase